MPTKHNNLDTCGDISALKGGQEASPNQMETDFKNTLTCSLNQPSCFTEEDKITPLLIRQVTQCGSPLCDALTYHPHISMI